MLVAVPLDVESVVDFDCECTLISGAMSLCTVSTVVGVSLCLIILPAAGLLVPV